MSDLTPEVQSAVEELFAQVLTMDPPARSAFLDSSDVSPAVRQEVQSLLSYHDSACARLETPMVAATAVVNAVDALVSDEATGEVDDQEPQQVGPYRVIRRIGEGGMGTVYLAEQEKPLRRRVALKLIKLGMDTRSVIARFDAERQAMAMMTHANVARALDAGVTAEGRPYFAMEFIDGERITRHCDEKRLNIASRLALFTNVCQAIQHAHQKGVIHRDIKPSNVLVCQNNGTPVPKVIDFGVAKATNHRLTEQSMYTEQGVLIGTPEYMSPEQAGSDGDDVDTRTDIYSLGVLLYELLVGALPLDAKSIRRAGMEDMHRMIREQDPPKPTTYLDKDHPDATRTAENRSTDVASLRRSVQGDLEWIVLKCLEKDRERRYATVAALIDDIQRYLDNQPVMAGPPGVSYRVRKFVRRHRGFVAAASVVLLVLAAGIVSTVTFAIGESRQRAAAETQAEIATAANEFLNKMLASVDPRNAGPGVTVRQVLDTSGGRLESDLADYPAVECDVRRTIGRSYLALGLYDEALPHFERALELAVDLYGEESEESAECMNELGVAFKQLGRFADAEGLHRRALDIDLRLFGKMDPRVAASMNHLAQSLYDQGKYEEGSSLYQRAYKIRAELLGEQAFARIASLSNLARERHAAGDYAEAQKLQYEAYRLSEASLGATHVDTVGLLGNVAFLAMAGGDYDEAERVFRETLGLYREHYGESHPDIARTINNLAECLRRQGRFEEAATLHGEGLAMRRETLGDNHPMVAKSLNNLGLCLTSLDQYDEAVELHEDALHIRMKRLGKRHPDVASSLGNLAFVLDKQGKHEEARGLLEEALEIRRAAYGNDHPAVANTQMNLARCLRKLNRLDEAEVLCRSALDIQVKKLGEHHPHVAATKQELGRVLTSAERYQEAESWLLESLGQLQAKFGNQSPHTTDVIEDLIALYELSGQTAKASRYREDLEGPAP